MYNLIVYFQEFSTYLQKLENTSKRLEIVEIIKELLLNLNDNETSEAVFLSLGSLKAPFNDEKFNIAEKMMLRALEQAYKESEQNIKDTYARLGDLGSVAEEISKNNKAQETTISQIYEKLHMIAKLEGAGSQDSKILKTAEVLKEIDSVSAKYIVRVVLGTMRLGFTEITIIDALVEYLIETKKLELNKDQRKELKKTLESIYYTHPDIGKIAETIKKKGLEEAQKIKIEVGVPILPQKAQRLPSFEEIISKMGTIWAEYKFDGTRVQLHFDKNKKLEVTELEQKSLFEDQMEERMFIKTFTRNLEETTYQYPDLVEAAKYQLKADSVVLDGEAIGFDPDTGDFLPFQQTMQRKRKHNVKEMAAKVPLKYFVFDLLYLNGETLTNKPLIERKNLLKEVVGEGEVIIVDDYPEISSVEELRNYFEDAREKGLEGLILKKPDAPYQAGARSYTWVKLKVADTKLLEDSVDVVVLGYYNGKGVRTQFGIGGFLVGIFDEEEGVFKSVTKVGTGLTDKDWEILKNKLDKVTVHEKPKNVEIEKIYTPDVWVSPEVVVELGADEITVSQTHSLGYALRFPRLIKFRNDKNSKQTTTPEEIKDMYEMQKRGTYN